MGEKYALLDRGQMPQDESTQWTSAVKHDKLSWINRTPGYGTLCEKLDYWHRGRFPPRSV